MAADVAAAAWADAAVAVPPALTDWGMVGYSINGAIESRRPVHGAACGAGQSEDARAAHCELNVTGPRLVLGERDAKSRHLLSSNETLDLASRGLVLGVPSWSGSPNLGTCLAPTTR